MVALTAPQSYVIPTMPNLFFFPILFLIVANIL